MKNSVFYIALLVFVLGSQFVVGQTKYERQVDRYERKIVEELKEKGVIKPSLKLTIDSLAIDKKAKKLALFFSDELTYLPVREEWLDQFNEGVRRNSKRRYSVTSFTKGVQVENLVPNMFRRGLLQDTSRLDMTLHDHQHVQNLDREFEISQGLNNRHIAIWGGHGMYYSLQDSIWTWQRSNLFTTIEDKLTFSMVVPYIIPMMERAGANVYYPKERDTQREEILIDNDYEESRIEGGETSREISGGFLSKPFYVDYENPFLLGSHLEMPSSEESGTRDSISYKFTPQQSGQFAVYVSYAKSENNLQNVRYEVHHSAGTSRFLVDQTMGWGTWVYLGTFQFHSEEMYKVVVFSESNEPGTITSDAIKIGGGYNRIQRQGTLCKYPAYMNGARYFLQYAGMPDSAVFTLHKGADDYKDDYKSRGEWVNYLLGDNYAWNRDSTLSGLKIPIDLSISVHTDAGITRDESIIGTLAIHSTTALDFNDSFPDGRTRYTNRDLTDIVQTEIVNTIRATHRSDWTRRSIWDKRYSEATYPNVPSMLIELFSHQNFEDMKYGLDPDFKFDISRAVYKGILKFLAYNSRSDYVLSPLRISDFSMVKTNEGLALSWSETIDPLEETARATGYVVYTQIGDDGFDNGAFTTEEKYDVENLVSGTEYSFKVTAVNSGGESFDSEVLSAAIFAENPGPVLIVNGFEKTSAPDFIESDSIAGFAPWQKSAIADGYEYSYTGDQYNFDQYDPWITDPLTGHGASYSTYDGIVKAGNTWDYPKQHGKHFLRHGISYISSSLRGFERHVDQYEEIDKIDLIYGKQSAGNNSAKDYSLFRPQTRVALTRWMDENKSLLISGSFIGSDVYDENASDTTRSNWVRDNLDYRLVSDHASESGLVSGQDSYVLNMKPSERIYELRNVDAISFEKNGKIIYRYPEKNLPAGLHSNSDGVSKVILGFPLESLTMNQQVLFDEVFKLLEWGAGEQ